MLVRLFVAVGLAMLITACDGEKSREIEWQLPLSVPEDPHGSHQGKQLPEWAMNISGKAKIMFLKKSTARTFAVALNNGDEVVEGDWRVHVQGIAFGLRLQGNTFINDDKVHNPAAFVALYQGQILMYEGWLYQDFPELFGMDNSDWKVWLEEVTMPQSSQEGDNLLP